MMSSITEHPHGALSIPASGPEERRARARQDLARLTALDPEQLPLALAFLSGYYPRVFDAVLEAVEPCGDPGAEDETPGREPAYRAMNLHFSIQLAPAWLLLGYVIRTALIPHEDCGPAI